jgi:hypothetical protein
MIPIFAAKPLGDSGRRPSEEPVRPGGPPAGLGDRRGSGSDAAQQKNDPTMHISPSMNTDPTVQQKLIGCSSQMITVRKYALPVNTAVTHAMIEPTPSARTMVTFSG